MDTLRSPAALAGLVARHLVPVAGVLFLGWSPGSLLVLLALDTVLALTAVAVLVMIHVTGTDEQGGPGGPVPWGKVVAATPILLALCALPVGVTLPFLLSGMDWSATALRSHDFQLGLAAQAVASVTTFAQMHRTLKARADDPKLLSRSLLFVVARWAVLGIAAFTGAAVWFGPRLGGVLLILVYGAASVWFELFPAHAARFVRGRSAKPIEQVIAEDIVADARRGAGKRRRRGIS